jgi:hypothetical protein
MQMFYLLLAAMGIRSDISTDAPYSQRYPTVGDGVIYVLCILYPLWLAGERLIAQDEGFYTYSAQLILEGQHPYLDYFYPQMPFLPYLYALAGALGGTDWDTYRVLSAICFSGILLLVYQMASREWNRWVGVSGVILLATCHLSFAWFSTVQTYALSTVLLFSGVLLLSRRDHSFWSALGVGLLFALAVQTRLFFLPLLIIPCTFFLLQAKRGCFLGSLILGILAGSLPSLPFLFLSLDSYLFSNLGYHLSRSSQSFSEDLNHKWRIFEVLFSLGRPSVKFDGFQTPFLFSSLFLVLPFWNRLSLMTKHCAVVGILLFGVSFLPNPTYVQYFVTVTPFAVVAFLALSVQLYTFLSPRTMRIVFLCSLAGIGIIYLKDLPTDLDRYCRTGQGVIGIGSPTKARDWNLGKVKEVKEAITRISQPDQEILAIWPGYLVGAHRRSVQGAENHFGVRAAGGVSEDERRRFHLVSVDELVEEIEQNTIPVVVGYRSAIPSPLRRALKENHYYLAKRIGAVQIYVSEAP